MTSQATQIQTLIDEIDAVLTKSNARLPWVMSGEAVQQRRVLEQTRQYLVTLQNQEAADIETAQQRSAASSQAAEESAQQVLQAVLQEMGYLRSHIVQPIRADIERLHQEREALTAEIQQLQAQRQQVLPPQSGQQQMIEDFMRSLMGRVQEQLTVQISQTVANINASNAAALSSGAMGALPQAGDMTALTPDQRIAQVQKMQAQSDQLLLKLDSTLRVIFESLQTSMQGYQESLGQGLEKMHSLGQQGEAMFAALVNRLAQQLGREASSYLQSSFQSGEWEPVATSQLPNSVSLQGLVSSPEIDLRRPSVEDQESGPIDQILEELKASGVSLEDDFSSDVPAISQKQEHDSEPKAAPPSAKSSELELPSQSVADVANAAEEDVLPLEPIAEWDASDELTDTDWSPDADLETLDSAFNVMEGLSSSDESESTPDSAFLDEEEDGLYESLFGVELSDEEAIAHHEANATLEDQIEPAETNVSTLGNDIEDDLFGGIPDPAEPVSASGADDEPLRDETLSELSTQTLEGLLFPSTGALFENMASTESAMSETQDGANFDANADEEDAYAIAHPEEDLLSNEVREQQPTVDLDLDNQMLDQLATDLQALETDDDSYTFTLTGFGEAIESPSEEEPSAPASSVNAFTLTGQDASTEEDVQEDVRIDLNTLPGTPPPSLVGETDTQPTLGNVFGSDDEATEASFEDEDNDLSTFADWPDVATSTEEDTFTDGDVQIDLNPLSGTSPSSVSETDTQPTFDTVFGSGDAPSEPALDETDTQPTLSNVFDSDDTSDVRSTLPETNPAYSTSTPASSSASSITGNLNLANDLNLIWESFETVPPQQTPPSIPDGVESGRHESFTLEDAFDGLDSSTSSTLGALSSSQEVIGEEQTDDDLSLDSFEASLGGEESSPGIDVPESPVDNGSSSLTSFASESAAAPGSAESNATLGDFFDALENGDLEAASEASLDEQDVFALDGMTIANLFEELPDEQPAGTSKKK